MKAELREFDVERDLDAFMRSRLSKTERRAVAVDLVRNPALRRRYEDMVVVEGVFHGGAKDVVARKPAACADVGPSLKAFLAGEVDGREALRVVRHLDACKSCESSAHKKARV